MWFETTLWIIATTSLRGTLLGREGERVFKEGFLYNRWFIKPEEYSTNHVPFTIIRPLNRHHVQDSQQGTFIQFH